MAEEEKMRKGSKNERKEKKKRKEIRKEKKGAKVEKGKKISFLTDHIPNFKDNAIILLCYSNMKNGRKK